MNNKNIVSLMQTGFTTVKVAFAGSSRLYTNKAARERPVIGFVDLSGITLGGAR